MSSFTMDSTDEIELARALGIGELRFIAKAHHGEAFAKNREGGGAVVGVRLPV